MWGGTATHLEMTEGDFGVECPFVLNGLQTQQNDTIVFTLKKLRNGESIFTQTELYEDAENPWFRLLIPKATSEILTPGKYFFTLDWYKNNQFYYCLIENGTFKVVDKA